jgi:hypothetical protein
MKSNQGTKAGIINGFGLETAFARSAIKFPKTN